MINPFYYSNRRGVPKIDAQSINVTTSAVEYIIPNNAFRFLPDNGIVLIRIGVEQPTGTTGTLPVVFRSNDATQAVTDVGGVAITAADLPSTGIYQFYYDKSANLMQIMSRTV